MTDADPNDPRAVLRLLEQGARKRFGQHFLADVGTVNRIVRSAEVHVGDRVVEIGPGLGILTRALLGAGAELTLVELDRDLAAYLRVQFGETARLIEADAVKVDWPSLCPGGGWSVVANLPYNVGTHLVMQLARLPQVFRRITVMLQKEVVDRLVAEPGSKAYGALSAELQVRGTARVVLDVPPGRFYPPPKVDSRVVRIDLFEAPRLEVPPAFYDQVVRAGFAHRRKTLPNSMANAFPRERVEAALRSIGVAVTARAETLDPQAFRRLAVALLPETPQP